MADRIGHILYNTTDEDWLPIIDMTKGLHLGDNDVNSCYKNLKNLNVDIELSDENGNIKFLREVPNRYACDMLTEREILVLLRVDRNVGNVDTYFPLLNDEESVNDEFIARLAGRGQYDSRPGSRRIRSNTRRPTKELLKNGQKDRSKEKLKSAKGDKRSNSRLR